MFNRGRCHPLDGDRRINDLQRVLLDHAQQSTRIQFTMNLLLCHTFKKYPWIRKGKLERIQKSLVLLQELGYDDWTGLRLQLLLHFHSKFTCENRKGLIPWNWEIPVSIHHQTHRIQNSLQAYIEGVLWFPDWKDYWRSTMDLTLRPICSCVDEIFVNIVGTNKGDSLKFPKHHWASKPRC